MHLCDDVAGIAAVRHSGGRVVTAAMDRMTFAHPVYVGQLVTVKATVNAAWRTSMEVGVRVESGERADRRGGPHLDRLPHDGGAGRRGPAAECRRSLPRRPTRRGGRARHSCVATPASPSGGGSRRSEALRASADTSPAPSARATRRRREAGEEAARVTGDVEAALAERRRGRPRRPTRPGCSSPATPSSRASAPWRSASRR